MNDKVRMYKNRFGAWTVELPHGEIADIQNTKTDGLQEAMNLAQYIGIGLDVNGGMDDLISRRPTPELLTGAFERNTIRCYETIRVPSLSNAHWNIEGVVIDFPNPIAGDGIRFEWMLHSTFNFRSALHYRGTGHAVHMAPEPRFDWPAYVIDNEFFFARIRVRGGDCLAGVKCTGNGVLRNRMRFVEIEGDRDPANPMTSTLLKRGIHVDGGDSNWFSVPALLGTKEWSIVSENGMANRYEAHAEPFGTSAKGVSASGRADHWHLDIKGSPSNGPGVQIASAAIDNIFLIQRNELSPPVLDNAPGGNNRFL